MRIQIISAAALLLAILAAGCNPVGMEDTKIWVTGTIYSDSTFMQPADGVGVMTVGTQESYVVVTDTSGEFLIEIQLYMEQGEESSGGTPGSATFAVTAFNGKFIYEYGDAEYFTVFGGDTLSLYSVSLTDFEESGSGGN